FKKWLYWVLSPIPLMTSGRPLTRYSKSPFSSRTTSTRLGTAAAARGEDCVSRYQRSNAVLSTGGDGSGRAHAAAAAAANWTDGATTTGADCAASPLMMPAHAAELITTVLTVPNRSRRGRAFTISTAVAGA